MDNKILTPTFTLGLLAITFLPSCVSVEDVNFKLSPDGSFGVEIGKLSLKQKTANNEHTVNAATSEESETSPLPVQETEAEQLVSNEVATLTTGVTQTKTSGEATVK